MGLSVSGVAVTLIGVIAPKWENRVLPLLLSHQPPIPHQILLPQPLGTHLLPTTLNVRNSKLVLFTTLLRLHRWQQPQLLHGRPQLVARGVARLGRNVGRKRQLSNQTLFDSLSLSATQLYGISTRLSLSIKTILKAIGQPRSRATISSPFIASSLIFKSPPSLSPIPQTPSGLSQDPPAMGCGTFASIGSQRRGQRLPS
jgi:hypothetical protein